MAESIYKLFDYQSPESIRSAYASNLFQPQAGGDLYSQLAQAGTNTGRALGAAAGRLFGYKLPGEAKAEAMDQVMAEAAKGSSPLAQATLAYEGFSRLGMGREAAIAMERVQELQKEEDALGFGRYMSDPDTRFETPEDYLKAARAAFASGKNTEGTQLLASAKALLKQQAEDKKKADLVKVRAAGITRNNPDIPAEVVPLIAEDDDLFKEWGKTLFEAKKNNYDVSYQTYDGQRVMVVADKDKGIVVKEVPLGAAPKTGTTINVGSRVEGAAETAKGKSIGEDIAAELKGTRESAEAANNNLPKMYNALGILRKEDINTGLGASFYDMLDQVRQQYLSDKKAGKKVDTQQYLDSILGSDVFKAINDLGIGARGIDTPAEKEFLLEVVTGKRTLSRGALIKITEDRIKNAEKSIEKFNDYLKRGVYKDYEKAGLPLSPIKLRSADKAPTVSNW